MLWGAELLLAPSWPWWSLDEPRGLRRCPLRDPRSPWRPEEGDTVPMCRVMCPTTFPLPREVTRRLLSQCPPLKSSFPSGDTASVREHRSAPGAKGPCRKRWVLVGKDDTGWRQGHAPGTAGTGRARAAPRDPGTGTHLALETVGSLVKLK